MPIARFQMPDGRVARFEVPDGTTPEQAQSMMAGYFKAPQQPEKIDPTADMSTADKFLSATGSGMASVGRAVGLGGVLKRFGLPSTKEEADQLDAPLMNTTAGKVGRFVGNTAAVAPAMLIPGANTYAGATLVGAGVGGLTTEGGLADRAQAAAFGALGGAAGKGLVDVGGKLASRLLNSKTAEVAANKAANATRDATLAAGRQAGYVVTPSQAGATGIINKVAEGLGGKIKTQQLASVKNQAVTDRLVRKSLGLADDTPLTPETLNAVRQQAGQAYEALRGLGTVAADADFKLALQQASKQTQGASRSFPGLVKANPVDDIVKALDQPGFDAGDAIDAVRVLRDQADGFYTSGDKASGKAIKVIANALEDSLERAAQNTGNPQLVNGFREARKTIAKTYTVQGALNQGAGTVNAQKLAGQLAKGNPLSGELKQVAQFSQAFPKATQSGVDVPAFSPLDVFSGGLGAGLGSPTLMAATASRPIARSLALNPAYQRAMVNPAPYQVGALPRLANRALNSETARLLSTPIGGLLAIEAAK